MNDEEKLYLPHVEEALKERGYPPEAIRIIMASKWPLFIVGDAWHLHVEPKDSTAFFKDKYLLGELRTWWLWSGGKMDAVPLLTKTLLTETVKRQKK